VAGKVADYRFDDPAGEVGVETILWRTDRGAILQTPLTYRAAPLADAETHLIGTSEHSVLGRRWVYDGCGDHVWAATLAETILTGRRRRPGADVLRAGRRACRCPTADFRSRAVAAATTFLM
jgi:hypothetical protein